MTTSLALLPDGATGVRTLSSSSGHWRILFVGIEFLKNNNNNYSKDSTHPHNSLTLTYWAIIDEVYTKINL